MNKRSRIKGGFIIFVLAITLSGLYLLRSSSHSRIRIEIISYLVRDRVIPLENIELRSTIIVGFTISASSKDLSNLNIMGELYRDNELISTDAISNLDSLGNNLGFDIPLSKGDLSYNKLLSIPDGDYLIVINLFDERRQLLAQCKKELKRNQLSRRFYGFNKIYKRPQYREMLQAVGDTKNVHRKRELSRFESQHYLIFQKSYLERVYPHTEPDPSECISNIFVELSRNEYKPLTFSLRALKNLGIVKVAVTPLLGAHGTLGADSITIGAIGYLTEIPGKDRNKNVVSYRWAPKIIESREVTIPEGHSQRYWLTLKVSPDAVPGNYKGVITIKPQFSHQTDIPINLIVLPLELTDTDIEYGMMMTYGFYELDNALWTDREKDLIKRSGLEIYKDFREHGLTTIYPHSCFYLKRSANGQPILHSLKASLEAYEKLEFPGPFCWYLGHLLQTAKPSHPGSILNYEEKVALNRLQLLLKSYEKIARGLNIPKKRLIVQLVDEADRQDRIEAGKTLNRIARDMGFKTLVTRRWPDVDIICTLAPQSDEKAKEIREMAKTWWIYPNDALTTKNRTYTRYVFGFGAWRWGVDGVVPWTFQMTQGCNGNPFTVLDGPEVMVAYPGVNGPVTTPTWESIREGINDYKYIFQLKRLITAGKKRGDPKAIKVERQLDQFKKSLGEGPGREENNFGDWPPGSFEKRRKRIMEWAKELYLDLHR